MNKITWINFLHFYQPATADNETIIEATEKSYKRIIRALRRNPRIKFSFNLAGCLVEKWVALGYAGLIKDIKKLIRRQQIELTGSAAWHPILPLLPDKEIERNILADEKILKQFFGNNIKLNGFFSPEAAYSIRLAKLIKRRGYGWLILDQISAEGKLKALNFSKLYIDKNSGLKICFRSREFSQSYVPDAISGLVKKRTDDLIITATDAELYGLRHLDYTGKFEKLLKIPEINTFTITEFLNDLKQPADIELIPSSWESTEKELAAGLPYALWQNKKNKIHQLLWRLANLAIKTVDNYQHDKQYSWARQHLDKGLASCTFWWASARDFKLFGSISWNPDEIERGANELIKSIRALTDPNTKNIKITAEKLYIKTKQLIWHKHWTYYWNRQF